MITVFGLRYLCRSNPNAGGCSVIDFGNPQGLVDQLPDVPVESCCRNDGKRDLAEGRISEREYQVIEETNAILDIHIREYAEALANGTSVQGMEALREIHKRDLKAAEMKQLQARMT